MSNHPHQHLGPRPGDDFKRTLEVDGRQRWYSGHVSSKWDGSTPLPLVVALHGATSNPRLMERFSALSDKADDAGFVVIYPAGTGNLPNVLTWNGGRCCGHAFQNQVDDVAWLDRAIADASEILPISRVHLAGMSNGAHMAYRYVAARAERIASFACVAGPMASPIDTIARPVPLLHIHGHDDEFAPFHGGQGPKSLYGAALPSIPETIAAWVKACDLPESPTIERFPDTAGDGTTVERYTYGPNADGVEVVLYAIHGAGHTWPGQPPLPLALGVSSANLDANDVIWRFFEKHAGREIAST